MGNPRANHPIYPIRCFLLIACGRHPEGGLSGGSRGESYLTQLWTTLQNSYVFYTAWPQITFTVTVRHFMAAGRGFLGALPIGSFTDTPLHDRMVNSPFTKGAKAGAHAVDPESSAEAYRCGESLATFFAVFVGLVLGGKMRAFNEACHRLSCREQGHTPAVYVSDLEAALLRVDANVTRTIARAQDVAAESGRRLVAGLSPLRDWTDRCLAPGQGGLTVLVDPMKRLDVADPDGVLQLTMAARRLSKRWIVIKRPQRPGS